MSEKEKFFTERDRALLKVFFLVYLVAVLVINWSDLSWFLNLKTGPQLIAQKLENIFSKEDSDQENDNGLWPIVNNEEEDFIACGENKITINSINISVPLVEVGGTTEQEYRDALDRGVIHFPGSAYPGEKGMTILLGHSAPAGWPMINHDWVFSDLDNLREGDQIEVCYKNRLTVYTVINEEIGKKIYEVGEDVPPLYHGQKKEGVLMTCWPPGSSVNRIGVRVVAE